MADPWFFDVLPCRPAPYPDECLSGYLLRLGAANGCAQLWDLARELFPHWVHPPQVTRLRWEYPIEDGQRLMQRTGLAPNIWRGLTVAPLVEKFRPPLALSGSDSLSPGHSLHGVIHPALRVCPRCLQADPYVRLAWRLAAVTACCEHGCLLQSHCPDCGRPLSAADPSEQHLRCVACAADLRRLPVVPAPATLLAAQARLVMGLRYLLDPERSLVPTLPPGSAGLPAAVGLKFRYLRVQDRRSLADLARQMGIGDGWLSGLERGARTPLALYPVYLEQFDLSWPEFAGLHVPAEFEAELDTPRHLPLRLCPTLDCPNHAPPPGLGVRLLADLPERRAARFRCGACGRNFTRGYDGAWLTKPRKPVIQPGDPPIVPKPPREVARLKAMGLRGEANRQIARALGWGEKTVRMYWIALGLEDRVHQAQAGRRAREQRQRQVAQRAQVEAALRGMRGQTEPITLRRVALAMGHGPEYLQSCPDLARRVKAVAGPHNAQVRRQRDAAVEMSLREAIAQMQASTTLMKVEALARPTGLTFTQLQKHYPALHALARRAVRSHREALRQARRQARAAAINAAAARLVAHGSRLTFGTILKEAKLSPYTPNCDLTLRELLHHWAGGFAPHD
ncbi:MAG: TniQ family protein [Anaerolineales bacterium]|nr:TniQ family protein [Anaerolineales bacterium]